MLEKTNRWVPTLADQTKAGSQKLRAERTKLGLVAGRGKVNGKHVIFTKLRSTYFHEVDSAAGFMDFNTPEVVKDTASFQRAAAKVGYTFNWFYADAEHTAYFNSGLNPVRAREHRPRLPGRREPRVAGLEPGHLAGALHPRSSSTRRPSTRPTSSTGTTSRPRPTAPPTTTPSPRPIAPSCSRTASRRRSRASARSRCRS